ncbi:MAG: hypothetical protein GWM98_17615 [Nitrospinaceae bacterium]|nr:hypothetical protein [Nitrospinaceae bacterium]NIR55967.1 hypothetical protein [Nitrospinaceae bacterium]NIS86410.1 hypothetical protein [Nitrospinaceae bacterium]NIT83248.1 hypothetical protein [Nitrospinaceae bacterium]NIU45455.1 hypothetical protein [Nitrospinaceae bacterium]
MSRSRWDETITWMQKEQGLWELDRELRNQILDYLETVRGPGSPADKKRPQASHMYEYHYPPNPL